MRQHDWGGANAYKAKYGVVPFTTVALRKSRHAVLQYARDLAERLYYFRASCGGAAMTPRWRTPGAALAMRPLRPA